MWSGTLWLVGMMGAGKSTVGPALAERLGRDFADSDLKIEASERRSISEIFERDGEAGFREIERKVLEGLAGRDLVVALGGGAIVQPGAREWLASRGTLIYLRALPETLLARLGSCYSRPLLRNLDREARLERLHSLLAERAEIYETAAVHVDTDDLDAEGIVDRIVLALEALGEDTGEESR